MDLRARSRPPRRLPGGLLALLLLALTGVAAALPAQRASGPRGRRSLAQVVAAARLPPIPSWVQMFEQRPTSKKNYELNVAEMSSANRRGRRYDLLLWGDSQTSAFADDRKLVWDRVFAGKRASPLGMVGSNLQETAFRITRGGEAPKLAPRVIVVLNGYINLRWRGDHPAPMMEWLVRWLKAAYPTSKVAVMALLPVNSTWNDAVAATNVQYQAVANATGALWVDCTASGYRANNTAHTLDGTHPAAAGQKLLLQCLKRAVWRYM